MNFSQLAADRYSVRKFKDKNIEHEKLALILKAGQIAPTAANLQPQRILVVNKKDTLDKLKQCTPYIFEAPLALIVCYDESICWTRKYDGQKSGYVDASIITTHMMLQATDLEIGSLWVMSFDPVKLKQLFNISEKIIPVSILVLGYAAENNIPHKMHTERFDIEKTVFYDEFKN